MSNKLILSCLFLSVFALPTWIFSQSFYVSTAGSNGNPGTLALPWQTIQHACNNATPGSTVYIKQGIYAGSLYMNASGTAGNYITFTRFASDLVVIDGGSTNTQVELLNIVDQSYVKIIGLQFKNAMGNFSKGVVIRGSSNHIEVSQNIFENINFSTNPAAIVNAGTNANALLVYGNNATNTITDVILDGNTITNCRTGFSEALTVNGNVSVFQVKNNVIHDITNIGIDVAGHFGACPDPLLDQARNGQVFGNLVYNCRSAYAVSAGIYVDGGKDVVVERNTVYQSGRGFEIGCENVGKTASNVVVRDNFAYLNDEAGIGIGGYNYPLGSGKVVNCSVLNNSLYGNATLGNGNGELLIEYTEGCVIQNNIFSATNNRLLVATLNSTGLNLNYNLWNTTGSAATATVDFNGTIYSNFAAYKAGTGKDANSLFANPNYLANNNLRISSNSPAINKGNPAFTAAIGETDFDGESRVQLSRVDIGADEQSVILPLEMLFFDGFTEGGKNHLRWQMADVREGKYFDVERNTEAGDFISLKTIPVEKASIFNFTDNNPPIFALYRLKTVDKNAQITYSKIIELRQKEAKISFYPNPTEGVVFVKNGIGEAFELSVYNAMGQLMSVFKNPKSFDLSNFKTGFYQIIVQQNGQNAERVMIFKQ